MTKLPRVKEQELINALRFEDCPFPLGCKR